MVITMHAKCLYTYFCRTCDSQSHVTICIVASLLYEIELYTYFQHVVHRVRLIDGHNSRTGRVEVYTNSTGGLDNAKWGAVCGDYWWSFSEARVVCRQLGYPDALVYIRYGLYGEGNGPYWLNGIDCDGIETDIFTCDYFGIEDHFCYYGSAGANCLGTCTITVILLKSVILK